MHKIRVTLVIVVLCLPLFAYLFTATCVEVVDPIYGVDWWPRFGHDLANSRHAASTAPRTNLLLWNFTTGGAVRSSAAVVDGSVYVGSFGGYVYALNANTGAQIWSYTTGSDVWSSPSVANDRVYVGTNDGNVYALNASTGDKLWNYTAGPSVFNGPAVANGVVYAASNDNATYALDAVTGAKIWNYTTAGMLRSCPAVVGGVVYLGSLGGFVYALDAATGTMIWNFTTQAGDTYMDSSPAVVGGVVYIGSVDGNVYALNAATGAKIWNYTTGSKVSSSPGVVGGTVYIGSEDGNVYALNSSTGSKIWSYTTGSPVYSSPALAHGVVYIGSWNGNVYALDSDTGALIWSYTTGAGVFASPAIANGVVYVGSYDKEVYAFGTPEPYPIMHQLKVEVSGQGTTNATGTGMYHAGSTISVRAIPSPGWILNGWLLNGTNAGSENPYSVIMNSNYVLTAVFAAIPPEQWPLFRHDLQRSGYSNSTGPNTNSKLWNYTTGSAIYSSPAVVDGKVYIGSQDGNLYCLEALTGELVWNYTTGGYVDSSPAIINGRVYVGSAQDHRIYCLNASTGMLLWNYTTGNPVFSSPAVADDRLYVGTYDIDGVVCLNASTGTKIWNYTTGGQIWSSPALADGKVYIGSIQDHGVYCLDALNGSKVWNFTTGGPVWSSPAVVSGRVFVGSNDNRTYCLDALTGTPLWTYTTDSYVESSPAVAYGRVYTGSFDKNVYCLNASTGTKLWNHTTGGVVWSSPAVVESRVYVGSFDSEIYCLDASTGALEWNYTTGKDIFSSPAVSNGKLYVGSADGNVYCFAPTQYGLSVTVSGQGTTNATGLNTYEPGSVVSIQAYPNAGWMLSRWLRNDSDAGSANPYVLTVNENVNLTAVFVFSNLQPSREPSTAVTPMQPVKVTLNATEIWSDVNNATLYYTIDQGASWTTQLMTYNSATNHFEATIPGQQEHVQVRYRVVVYYKTGSNATVELEYGVESEVWVPSTQGAAVAAVVTVGATVAASTLASVASASASSASQGGSKLIEKVSNLLPDTTKKWLSSFVSSKSKAEIKEKAGSRFILTKEEIVSYVVTVSILTLAFAYAKAPSLNQILESIPAILATSIAVSLVKTYALTFISRHIGVWTEYRLWYLGLSLFALSTLAFKVPFSSPSRLTRHSAKMTKRIGGMLSSISIILAFVFALIFLILFVGGYRSIGSIGVIMCLTGVFFDTIPISPMSGKSIYDWNKIVWLILFAASISSYVVSLFLF